jgi:hypothetical protein
MKLEGGSWVARFSKMSTGCPVKSDCQIRAMCFLVYTCPKFCMEPIVYS